MSSRPDDLMAQVERLARSLALGDRVETAGLQRVHLQVLGFLREANRYSNTPRAVADFLGQTRGTVSQTLLLLERRGLVVRAQDGLDRRVVRLALTPRGRRLAERAGLRARWGAALEGVPPASLDAAAEVLTRALAGLQRGEAATFGACLTCRHLEREGGERFACGLTGEALRRAETDQACREHEWR